VDEISLDKGFTGEDFSVLLHLVGRLDRDMLVRMTMDEIAEALELESAEVSRVLEKLIGMGILKCIGKDRNWVYVLNPKLDSNTLGLNVLKHLST
jgi:predicted transcriptional regulator